MNQRFTSLLVLLLLPLSSLIYAGEGMWLPQLLKLLNESEMKSMGMKISAEDIYSINKGSLKDAIVHFGGFCTSEVISPNGLLLTNHHCGYGQIQAHSTIENNLLKDGFWAKNYQEELPNTGLTATFIDYIDDITTLVLDGVTDQLTAAERQIQIDKNLAAIRKTYKLESYQSLIIRPFFDGNQYFAFVTTTYRDVRLVGAPPESIGKFGSDTDNWVWPRHTGDFSLFRIYADKDNKPADYAPDNVPFKPKYFLPISLDGVSEGDFTLVFGFPGRTNQYLPSSAIRQLVDVLNPAKIAIRETALDITDKYMRKDEATKIKYASKYASIANYWKKWIGESTGLKKTSAIDKKLKFEREFQSRLKTGSPYAYLLSDLHQLYKDIEPYALAKDYYNEIVLRNIDLTSYLSTLSRLVNAYENNGEVGYNNQLSGIISYTSKFYKNFDSNIDQEKFAALIDMYVSGLNERFVPDFLQRENLGMQPNEDYQQMAKDLYTLTSFSSEKDAMDILNLSPEKAIQAIKSDPAYALVSHWSDFYAKEISQPYNQYQDEINLKQALYTRAQLETFPEKRFYPDANSTMRVTYGQVNGYVPRDAVYYEPVTYLDGVIEKYVPGDYEFDVPQKMLELYNQKDYGQYADKSGKLPVCFLGSNHTTGGNSGSPAIDAWGNLIGLNFDRVWEGTMSDINYDERICRNIMVDARYILWVIDKYAGAGHLIKEMKLVHPKKDIKAPMKSEKR
ncbi:MAG: S46 family peptidase [Saprospiraceae bacterium]|nr:MAG: dipeptidyl-peptidase 7 [Bacteroidetes bacterium OLB9]MCO6464813.1 S46 family peptidase [Saprospiraceae bacterium]MCZ2339147.1 S46 family peptidase [Chitinophagales bacterium]